MKVNELYEKVKMSVAMVDLFSKKYIVGYRKRWMLRYVQQVTIYLHLQQV